MNTHPVAPRASPPPPDGTSGTLPPVPPPGDTTVATTSALPAQVGTTQPAAVPGKPIPPPYAAVKLPDYTFLSLLGQGGMAVVFLARQERLNRLVAVKMLPAQWGNDQAFMQRLEREAVTIGNLNHPHIVGCHDIVHDASGTFLILDFVPGSCCVRRLVQHYGRLPEDLAFKVVRQAVRGLAYAQARGVVHRDVKPDNLLVYHEFTALPATAAELLNAPTTRIMLADFGLAKGAVAAAHLNEVTSPGLAVGSPAYMAPEQALGQECDCRADIYALGATLFHLLTGAAPFRGETPIATLAAKLNHDLPPLRDQGVTVAPGCQAILSCMTARQPADRYADYPALLAALEAHLAAIAGNAARAPERPAAAAGRARRWTWLVVVVLVLLAAGAGARWWHARHAPDLSLSLAPWQGDFSHWQLKWPDDEDHAARVLTALDPGPPLVLRQPVPANRQLTLALRLPNDGAVTVALGSPTAPAWTLTFAREQIASTFSIALGGQPMTLPVASESRPYEWHTVEIDLLQEEVVLYLDGELAGHQVLATPAPTYPLTLTLTSGSLAQFRGIRILPLRAAE